MPADAMRDFPVANNQASVVRSLGVCPDRGACPGRDYLIILYQSICCQGHAHTTCCAGRHQITDVLTVRGARISACQTRGPGPVHQHADHSEYHADVAIASWRPNAAAAPASLFQSGDAQNGAGLFRQSSIARFDSASSEAFQQCSTVDPATGLPPQPGAPMHAALHRYNSSLEGAACVTKSGSSRRLSAYSSLY